MHTQKQHVLTELQRIKEELFELPMFMGRSLKIKKINQQLQYIKSREPNSTLLNLLHREALRDLEDAKNSTAALKPIGSS